MAEEMEMDILVSQIDAMSENLKRIKNLFESQKNVPEFRSVYGKFTTAMSPLNKKLEDMKLSLQVKNQSSEQVGEVWREFSAIKHKGQTIFDQCLDVLGGYFVRNAGLEGGICDIANELIRYYSEKTGRTWLSLMILGEERLFDKVAETTEIIRLRFPEWDIWTLPFTAYEFGQLIPTGDTIHELNIFLVDEVRAIERFITEENVPKEELDGLAPEIQSMREGYQAGRVGKNAVEHFGEQQRFQIKSLFSDMFATYILGPAYIYARLFLRLDPTEVFQDQGYKPSMARRIACMLSTLEKMEEKEKQKYETGSYASEINRIRDLWKKAIRAVNPDYQGELIFGKPYDNWFEQVYQALQTYYSDAALAIKDWNEATKIGMHILDPVPPNVSSNTDLSIVINAAWYCRVRNPEFRSSSTIESRARDMCEQAISEKSSQGLQKPGEVKKQARPRNIGGD